MSKTKELPLKDLLVCVVDDEGHHGYMPMGDFTNAIVNSLEEFFEKHKDDFVKQMQKKK